MDKVSTRIDIPVDLHNHIKIYCARNQITMRDLIVSSVSERILSKPVSSVPRLEKIPDAPIPVNVTADHETLIRNLSTEKHISYKEAKKQLIMSKIIS